MKVEFIYALIPSDQSIASKGIKRHTMVTASIVVNNKRLATKILTYNRKQADQLWKILDNRLIEKFVCGIIYLKEIICYEPKEDLSYYMSHYQFMCDTNISLKILRKEKDVKESNEQK